MKTRELIANIKELNWVFFWSGNWPLLDCIYQRDSAFERQFEVFAGIYSKITVDFFREGIITAYHCLEEYDRLENFFKTRFREDPYFILRSMADYQKRTTSDVEAIKKMNQKNLVDFPCAQLADLFVKVRKHFEYNAAMDHYAWYLEKFFIPEIQQFVEAKLSLTQKHKLIPEYVFTLVTPQKPSKIFRERTRLFNMISSMKEDRGIVSAVLRGKRLQHVERRFPHVKKFLEEHLHRFSWLPVLVNNPPTSKSDLWNEIVHFIKGEETFQVESKRIGDNFDASIAGKRKKIMEELQPDERTKILIETMQEVAFIRTEDNAIMSQSSYLVIPLYTEIAKRLGLTYHDLKEFIPEEIADHLKQEKQIPRSLLRERRTLTTYVVYNGERIVLTNKDAVTIKEIVEKQTEHTKDTTIFHGTPASIGRITGKVKVVLSSKDAVDIEQGEILVAPATSADFVPAMKRAGAIITEFGGITSHAAVVSREFGIPCIVGVCGITKILSSGDIVEVDGNKGEITKMR